MREVLGQSKGWVEGTRGQAVFSLIPLVAGKMLKGKENPPDQHVAERWLPGTKFGLF